MFHARSGMEGMMGGLTMWWHGRKLAFGQQRRQEGNSHAAGTWRRQRVAGGISLLLLTLVATAAYGQRLTLTPSLSVEERYDDNIFESRTRKTDDFVTVVSPGIHLQYLPTEPTPGTQLDFDYRADFESFADNSSQNQVAHRLSLTFESQLAPSLRVRLRDLLLVTDDPLGLTERLGNPTGLRPASEQQRAPALRNEAQGAIDVRLGGRTSLGVRFESLIDDVDIPGDLDEFRYTVGTELGYVVNVARESRVLVAYQVTFHTFRDNGGVLPENARAENARAAFQVHTISAGGRHTLTPTLAVNAVLGYSFTNSDAPQADGQKAVSANVDLTKTFHIGQASLGYVRSLTSGEANGGVVLDNTVSANVSINLTGKLTAKLDSNVTRSDFQGVTTSDLNQVFWSVRPSLTYQILRPWRVSAAYAYEFTNFMNDARPNIEDHRLLVGTQFVLREWLMLGLSYRYASRHLHGDTTVGGIENFARNQVMLTVTASPNFRF
jgi:hypothetical protein